MDSRETGEGATARSTGDLAHKFCSRTYLVWWTNASTWCLNGWMALLAGDLSIVWHQTVSQSSAGASGWWQWPPKCGTRWTIIDRRQTGSWRVRNVERQSHQLWGCRVRLSLHTHTHTRGATHSYTHGTQRDTVTIQNLTTVHVSFLGPVRRCQFSSIF